ncbi:MAG: ELM1/GtrOC1 family putative glycosyltransferase, partial [Pseudomonadales bacterium]|nr:ELM1/GtrOC1 family putative glycosyltransferase [Pseudomonadales bacterium]
MNGNHRAEGGTGPLVWLLQGRKAGDNAQLEAVAEALASLRACRVERVPLDFRRRELAVNLLLGVSLLGLQTPARARLAPPWPDLILTAGRRNEPVARWVQRANHGRTRLVHFGRPWARPDRFDLVVTTPQYFLDPERWPNLLALPLPPVPLAPRAEPGREGPLLLLVGGDSGSKVVDTPFARATLEASAALAAERGTALRVTTSPRTPPDVERELLAAATQAGAECFPWHARSGADNPYRRWLAEASGVVVTADSISMVAEAAASGGDLWIARLPEATRPWWLTRRGWRWKSATHELAQKLAPLRFRRDTERLLSGLVASGRARWLEDGDAAPDPGPRAVESDASRAARAVAA